MVFFERIGPMSKERMSICGGCEYLTPVKTCKLCGCFMPVKVAVFSVSCPDGKWKEEV